MQNAMQKKMGALQSEAACMFMQDEHMQRLYNYETT